MVTGFGMMMGRRRTRSSEKTRCATGTKRMLQRKAGRESNMAYSEDINKAERIAAAAHTGAVDKSGKPYIEHPERVAAWVKEPREKVVAWLHDVVEDTDFTLGDIEREFGPETAAAVNAITHRKDEPWADYLMRVKSNEVARTVKIADLIDNSNLSRLTEVRPKDVKRQAKYNRALYFLMNVD